MAYDRPFDFWSVHMKPFPSQRLIAPSHLDRSALFSLHQPGENGALQIANECDLFLQTNLG